MQAAGFRVSCDILKLREHPKAERYGGSVNANTGCSSKFMPLRIVTALLDICS